MDSREKASAVDTNATSERPRVRGVGLDPQTRCAHYRSALDIIAIKVPCCGEFYACKECHDALADHPIEQWSVNDYGTRAILCGECGALLTIAEYLKSASMCPECGAKFNPRCSLHHHFYFADRE